MHRSTLFWNSHVSYLGVFFCLGNLSCKSGSHWVRSSSLKLSPWGISCSRSEEAEASEQEPLLLGACWTRFVEPEQESEVSLVPLLFFTSFSEEFRLLLLSSRGIRDTFAGSSVSSLIVWLVDNNLRTWALIAGSKNEREKCCYNVVFTLLFM